jgi:predicted nuclease of predicted toxin-antitoxin system
LRVLVDMNLSPAWVEALREMGFDAVHWSTVGDPRAPDRDLLAYAKAEGFVVFTNDLDFGAILAASAASSPSVIQARAADLTPTRLGPLVRDALIQYAHWLETGALITIEEARLRARILPLK